MECRNLRRNLPRHNGNTIRPFIRNFTVLCLAAASVLAQPPAGRVRVGAAFSIPMAYVTPEGEPVGFFVDVFREAAKREKIDIQFVIGRGSPDRFLDSGAGEIWVAAVATKARRARFHVTSPWWILDTYVATLESSGIRNQRDLAGKNVLDSSTPPYSVPLDEFLPGAKIKSEENVGARFEALCQGKTDAVLFYEATVHGMLGTPEFAECRERGIRIVAFDRPVRELSIMSAPSSKAVADRLRTRIEEMKKDGTVERLPSFSQTGNELWKAELEAERNRKVQQMWRLGLGFAGVLLLGSLFAYTRLRAAHKEVRKSLELSQQAVKAKSEFLATMSHEIRTPMTAVLGYLDLLLATPLRPDQQQFTREVTQATESLLTMLTEILNYSGSVSGPATVVQEPFDPVRLVDDCVVSVQLQAESKGLELLSSIGSSVPKTLTGDGGKLRHLILNLLTNAVKYTEAGSVELRAEYIAKGAVDGTLRITVKDTGIGIAKDQLQRIFLPFTQVDSTHTRKQGGIGLGLAIVSTLCKQMGGKVEVQSADGAGSEFTVELPMPRAKGMGSWLDPGTAGIAVSLWSMRPQVEILSQYLAGSGYRIVETNTVDEFLTASSALDADARPLLLVDGKNCTDADFAAIMDWKQKHPGRGWLVLLASMGFLRDCGDLVKYLPDIILTLPVPGHALRELTSTRISVPVAPSGDGLKVLVVDDNEVNRRILSALLKRLGCEVDNAVNGADAVEKVRNGKAYSLVLMDCQMPVMNGFDAARTIRTKSKGDLPIWGVSAALESEIRQQCLDSGMDDYLAKPVSIETLGARLKSLRDRYFLAG